MVYADIAMRQYEDHSYADYYNVGPDLSDVKSALELAEIFCREWGEGLSIRTGQEGGPHEAAFLKLDCTKIKEKLGWKSVWNVEEAVKQTVLFSRVYYNGGDLREELFRQIDSYVSDSE